MLIAAAIAAVAVLLFVRIVPRDVHIVDADTIAVGDRRWRLAGYDAPEHDQPGGSQASAHLRQILDEGRAIGIITGSDVYGRLVVRVITRRGPLAWRMMIAGWGHPESPLGWMPMLVARIARRGVWGIKGAVLTPRLWREMHPKPSRPGYRPARSSGGGRRAPRLNMGYDHRKGLKLPGGFIIP